MIRLFVIVAVTLRPAADPVQIRRIAVDQLPPFKGKPGQKPVCAPVHPLDQVVAAEALDRPCVQIDADVPERGWLALHDRPRRPDASRCRCRAEASSRSTAGTTPLWLSTRTTPPSPPSRPFRLPLPEPHIGGSVYRVKVSGLVTPITRKHMQPRAVAPLPKGRPPPCPPLPPQEMPLLRLLRPADPEVCRFARPRL